MSDLTTNSKGLPIPISQAMLSVRRDFPEPGSPVSNKGIPRVAATSTAAARLVQNPVRGCTYAHSKRAAINASLSGPFSSW